MDKQTRQLLLIGAGLALVYYFKNRPTSNTYGSESGNNNSQSDYADGGGVGGGQTQGIGVDDMVGGGSGYVASGDDDTTSIANDPTTSFTGTVSKPQVYKAPIVGGKYEGVSGKPVVGVADINNKLPLGASTLSGKKPSGGSKYFK